MTCFSYPRKQKFRPIFDLTKKERPAVLFAVFCALILSVSYFFILPTTLNPTVVLEPVLFRKGYLPFNNIGDQKPPLLQYALAALLPLFRGNIVLLVKVMHGILIFVIVAGSLIWTYRAKGVSALLPAAFFFGAWSFIYGYDATLYYDIVLTPFYLLTFYILNLPENKFNWRLFTLLGLISGTALLIKQYAITLVIIAAGLLLSKYVCKKIDIWRLLSCSRGYILGFLFPVLLFVGVFLLQGGSIREMYFWTVQFNLTGTYSSMATEYPDGATLLHWSISLILVIPFLWSLIYNPSALMPSRKTRCLLVIFLLATAVFVLPRWSDKHLAPSLPFIAAISGIACSDLICKPEKSIKYCGLVIVFLGLFISWGYYAINGCQDAWCLIGPHNYAEYSNLFPLADEIKKAIPADGKLAIAPSDEGTMNLYYILKREPPRFLCFNYPWFIVNATIQKRWLASMADDKPTAVIYFRGRYDWEKFAPTMSDYIQKNYRISKESTWQGMAVHIMVRR